MEPEQYNKEIFPVYIDLLERTGITPSKLLVGTCDSFLDLTPRGAGEAFKKFLAQSTDGISIDLNSRQVKVSSFTYENSFAGGVYSERRQPYEPVIVSKLKHKAEAILEFESLLRKDTTEDELEKFLATYYKDVFGARYDRVETQIWLRFPELDVAGKERRLD